MSNRGEALLKAHEIINGQRQDAHGNPEDSFSVIALLWNTYLFHKKERYILDSEDVAVMMALMKIARITTGSAKSDSYIDCCGYIALAADMHEDQDVAD